VKAKIKNKIIFLFSLIITTIIILNPSIPAVQYNHIENTIKNNNNNSLVDNELLIVILDIIIKLLESIFVIPLIIVEEIIDIIWELIDQIEDPLIKTLCTIYNLIIEILWYICLGLCFPIFIIVNILTLIRNEIEPN
jgi:hypothetical protein